MANKKAQTATVDFLGEKRIEVAAGESLLQAALRAGIPHYHTCGGNARCSTCRVVVRQGIENLIPPGRKETVLRRKVRFPETIRLACQTFIEKGTASVHRIIRDVSDLALYVDDSEIRYDELGEERELTLLFLDIRDFTPFMENYLPFDVMHLLRKLFSLFRTCIEEHGGRIIETAGDGLYAAFGLSTTADEAAANAVAAGRLIFTEGGRFNTAYVETYFRHRFQIGIGLHSGLAVVGNVGIGINNNLSVMGLAVNIASRIQAATKDLNNSFLVSETTMSQEFENHPAALLSLKGISEPVKVYLLGEAYYEASAFRPLHC